jgi:hypothetical protein
MRLLCRLGFHAERLIWFPTRGQYAAWCPCSHLRWIGTRMSWASC